MWRNRSLSAENWMMPGSLYCMSHRARKQTPELELRSHLRFKWGIQNGQCSYST